MDIRSGCGALGSQRPWYLGAKQAKLRRASLVPMRKTADLGYRDHVSLLWRLDSAGNGRILSQCQMCPGSMIVGQEASDSASEMSFAEDDDVVEAFPAQGPDHSLKVRRLPGTAWCGDKFLDIEGLHLVLKCQPVNSIPVADEVSCGFSIVEGLNQLASSRGGSRMLRHIEVHDLAAIMSENDQNE